MPRAYLRIDPNLDLTQADPARFVRLLCAAARQPDRGRFRDLALLRRAVGKARASTFVARADVVQLPDGRWYVEGWDEWQEGDLDRRREDEEDAPSARDKSRSCYGTTVTRTSHRYAGAHAQRYDRRR